MTAPAQADDATGAMMCAIGACSNSIQTAPILGTLAAHTPKAAAVAVHTGQHYDQGEQLLGEFRPPRDDANVEIASASHAILAGVDEILAGRGRRGRVPDLWDGQAGQRIAGDSWQWLQAPGLAARAA
jgi:hypothetical protein